jgi:hypothetical protein
MGLNVAMMWDLAGMRADSNADLAAPVSQDAA